eukprot:2996902-Amphidinium_carterae.1
MGPLWTNLFPLSALSLAKGSGSALLAGPYPLVQALFASANALRTAAGSTPPSSCRSASSLASLRCNLALLYPPAFKHAAKAINSIDRQGGKLYSLFLHDVFY